MGIDLEALFRTIGPIIGNTGTGDEEAGGVFCSLYAVLGDVRLCP